jgi:hypothetical protein
VDFLRSVDREQWAIDLKASRQVDARDLKGLGAFRRTRPEGSVTDCGLRGDAVSATR